MRRSSRRRWSGFTWKRGDFVQLHYSKKTAHYFRAFHGRRGRVEVVTRRGAGGPRNALVRLGDGTSVVVPIGNLRKPFDPPPDPQLSLF